MAWLILNDEVDYQSTWYPTHIIDKHNKLLPVYIGASQTLIRGLIGIWIKDEHYDFIRHDKAYIFLHNPEAADEDIEEIDWNKVPDAKENKTVGREHIHLWNEPKWSDKEKN